MLKMKYGWRFAFAGAIVMLLIGCVTRYAPPVGEDTAQIDFVNSTALQMAVFLYGDATKCTQRAMLTGGVAAGAHRPVTVATNKELAVLVFDADSQNVCRLTLSFQPEKAKNYVFRFLGSPENCRGGVAEVTNAGAFVRKVTTTERTFVLAFDESGHWCEAK